MENIKLQNPNRIHGINCVSIHLKSLDSKIEERLRIQRHMTREEISSSSSGSRAKANGSMCSKKTPIVPIRGPPVPLSMLPPPINWPMFSAVPAVNGQIMARNHNGSGK